MAPMGPFLRKRLGAATEQMLDLAHTPRPRRRVLDMAAGAGEQSLAAARRVGPTGYVLAMIAPALLDYALADARAAGLPNIETRELDGEAAETCRPRASMP